MCPLTIFGTFLLIKTAACQQFMSHYGTAIEKGIRPSYVSIQDTVRVGHKHWTQFCGGALISSRQIATAAHCLHEGAHSILTVHLDYNGRIFTDKRFGRTVRLYPYERHDFALVTLDKPVTFNENIKSVATATRSAEPGANCLSVGGGRNERGRSTWDRPTQINTTVTSAARCCQNWQATDKDVCTWHPYQRIDDGDSGGPLYCRDNGVWKLYGVANAVMTCSNHKRFNMFSGINYYRDFIKKHFE